MRIVGAALLFAVTLFLLREFGWRAAPLLCVMSSLFLFFAIGEEISALIFDILSIQGENYTREISAAIKVLGVGYLFGIASDMCRTLGEAQIAKTLDIVGRVEILTIIMPFFKEIIELGVGLLA